MLPWISKLILFVFGFSVILGIHVSNLIKDSFGCGFFHYISFTHWLHQNRNVVSLGCICLEQMFFEHFYIVMSFPIFLSWIFQFFSSGNEAVDNFFLPGNLG